MRRSLRELGDGRFEQGGVFPSGGSVVNRARTNEDQESRIEAGEDARDLEACVEDGGLGHFSRGALLFKKNRRQDDFGPLNP